MELPLTEPCPQCGADMEPHGVGRRKGGTVYVCPDCGYEAPIPERTGDHGDPDDVPEC